MPFSISVYAESWGTGGKTLCQISVFYVRLNQGLLPAILHGLGTSTSAMWTCGLLPCSLSCICKIVWWWERPLSSWDEHGDDGILPWVTWERGRQRNFPGGTLGWDFIRWVVIDSPTPKMPTFPLEDFCNFSSLLLCIHTIYIYSHNLRSSSLPRCLPFPGKRRPPLLTALFLSTSQRSHCRLARIAHCLIPKGTQGIRMSGAIDNTTRIATSNTNTNVIQKL